jgi:hypothetical protein
MSGSLIFYIRRLFIWKRSLRALRIEQFSLFPWYRAGRSCPLFSIDSKAVRNKNDEWIVGTNVTRRGRFERRRTAFDTRPSAVANSPPALRVWLTPACGARWDAGRLLPREYLIRQRGPSFKFPSRCCPSAKIILLTRLRRIPRESFKLVFYYIYNSAILPQIVNSRNENSARFMVNSWSRCHLVFLISLLQ